MSDLKREIGKRGPFDSLEQEVFLNLQRSADVLGRPFEELFKQAGISSPLYNILRILRGAGEQGLTCGEIAGRMITRHPDITRLLDRLEKRSLITRCRDKADRRIVKTRITRQGEAVVEKLDEPVRLAHKTQLGHMSEQQLRTLLNLLEVARS